MYHEERLTSEGDDEDKSVSGSEGCNQMSYSGFINSTFNYEAMNSNTQDLDDINYEQVSQMLVKIRIFSTLRCPQLCDKILELEQEFNELLSGKESRSDVEFSDSEN